MKKSLLLMLFLALTWSWTAKADELTVYDGTTTNSYVPAYIGYFDDFTKSQYVIPADSLGVMENGNITSIHFYTSLTAAYTTVSTVDIYLAEVAETTISAYLDKNNATIVYQGTLDFELVNGQYELTIEFSSPYKYNGGNLLIGVENTTDAGYKFVYFYGKTVTGASISGSNGSSLDNVSANQRNFIPKTTFVYTAGSAPTCEKPSSLVASNVEANSADLTWDGGSGTYNVEYKKAADEEWTSALANTALLTTSLSNLDAATNYQARVQSVCGSDVSGWKSASFVTPCGAYDIPYEYGFEDATPFSCWHLIAGAAIAEGASNAHNGTKYLKFSGTTSNMIALPEFTAELNTLRLEFWTRPESNTNSNCGQFAVGYVTDLTDSSTFVPLQTYSYNDWSAASYVKKTVDFNNAPADAHIAMRQFNNSTSWYWYVDDIEVKEIPSCLAPTGLNADNITNSSADLSWTEGGSESEWKIYYKKSGDTEFSSVTVSENPYILEGLDASSTYQFYVKAVCSATEESEESDIASFSTECDAISTLPWSEDFNAYAGANSSSAPAGYPDDELPICWQFLNRSGSSSTYPQVFISSNYGYAVSGNCLFFKSSSSTPLYAILPEFAEDIAGLQLSFTYRNESTSDSNGTLHVGYITDPSDASKFVSVLSCPRTTTLTEKEVLFDGAPAGSYIAFKYEGGSSSNYYLSIDNVSVDVKPSCLKPSALMLETPSSRTAHAASLKWTKGEESQSAWEIAYSKLANFNPNEQITDSIASADRNPFTLSGLEQSTTYYAYVRANCGIEDGKSDWSSSKASFTTLSGHQALSNLALVDGSLESQSAEVNWKPNAYNELHASYEIYYSQLSTLPATEEALSSDGLIQNISDTFYVFSNLDPETQYYVWVRDNCATDGLSAWSSRASFTTLANCAVPFNVAVSEETAVGATIAWNGNSGSYDVQYRTAEKLIDVVVTTESFTDETPANYDATSYELPKDWYSYNSSSSGNAPRVSNSSNYSYISLTGNYLLLTTNATNQSAYAIMPKYNNIGEAQFTYKYESTSYGTLSVGYVTDKSGYDTYTVLKTPQKTTSATVFELSAEDIAAINSANGYIAFCYESGSSTYYSVGIDDIVVATGTLVPAGQWQTVSSNETEKQISGLASETKYDVQVLGVCGATTTEPSEIVSFTTLPSCLPVSNLEVSDITASSADFTWVDNSEQTQWQYACVDAGVTPENWTLVINAASVNVSGLTANTPYDFYVRAYCGVDDHSEAIKLNFRTECETAVLPFVESFDSLKVANSIPDCWDNSEGTTTSDGYKWSFNTSTSGNGAAKGTGVDGGNCVRFDSYSNYEDNTNLLATPIINLSEDAVLTFWWKNPTGGAGEVLISVDGDDKVSLLSEGLTSISSWTFKNINLSTYTGHNVQIFFKGTSNWGYDDAYLYLDNVCVAPIETIAIGESLYATYYNEEKGYIMPENLTGHVFSTENTPEMLVQEYEAGDIVPAATPLVLEATAAGNYSLVPTIGGVDPDASNQLVGVNEAGIIGSATDGYVYYVLSMNASNEPESVGFYYMLDEGKGGFSMPAHKAYLKYTASSAPARFFLFNGENGATWLENLQGVEGTVKFMHEGNIYILRDGIIYDATGRKVRELK